MKHLAFLLLLLTLPKAAEAAPTVIPNSFTSANVCYTEEVSRKAKCKLFKAPNIMPDFGPVDYIMTSPIDPARNLNNLPTVGLAYYHLWLFTQELFRAQRQYAACISEKGTYQQLLSRQRDDDPLSPQYLKVTQVREYEIPFRAETTHNPNRPPTKKEIIAHVIAAANSHNNTVAEIGLCRYYTDMLRQEVIKNKRNIK